MRASTSAPILHHFNRALSPTTHPWNFPSTGNGGIHPVAFYSRILSGAELNHDTHDEELLAIYGAFKTWCQYLESPHYTIDMVTDHKSLEYFSSTKLLIHHQARRSEYLSAFNMVVRFHNEFRRKAWAESDRELAP